MDALLAAVYKRGSVYLIVLPGEAVKEIGNPTHVEQTVAEGVLHLTPLNVEGAVVKMRVKRERGGRTRFYILLPPAAHARLAGAAYASFERLGDAVIVWPGKVAGLPSVRRVRPHSRWLYIPAPVYKEMGRPTYVAVAPVDECVKLVPLRAQYVRKLCRVWGHAVFAAPKNLIEEWGGPRRLIGFWANGRLTLKPAPPTLPSHRRWWSWMREARSLAGHQFSCSLCGAQPLSPLAALLHAVEHGVTLPANASLKRLLLHLQALGAASELPAVDEEKILTVLRERLAREKGSYARVYLADVAKRLALKPGRSISRRVWIALHRMHARGLLNEVDGWRAAGFGHSAARRRGFIAFTRKPPEREKLSS